MKNGVTIRQPDDGEFEEIKKYVEEFWLDDTNMLKEQFKTLMLKDKLAAFCRFREHLDATEMCTLG